MRRALLTSRTRRVFGVVAAALAVVGSATATLVVRAPAPAAAATTAGYWLVGTDGGVFSFGQAPFHGSTGGIPLNQPIVSMTPTPTGRGYWMVASDGGVFAFGDAGFFGSMGGKPLNKPIVAMSATPTGRGYWMVAADGGIFAFGDALFRGSMGGEKLNRPIVDMAATPSGRGYWMTATDGGMFAFGDAGFFGSTGNIELALRIHAMAPTPTGRGYWMVAGDGGIFAFGDAGFHGSAASDGKAEKRVIDIASSATGKGYYVTTSNGQVLAYGDVKAFGGTDKMTLNNRIVAMAANNANEAPVAVDDVLSVDEDGTVTLDVLANDSDPDGGPLTLRSVSTPGQGAAAGLGRSVIYRPAPDFNGSDSFTYTVADDRGETAVGRVGVAVKAIDDKPDAVDDTVNVLEDLTVGVAVLNNDNGLGDGVATLTVAKPGNGTASVNNDRTISYRPKENFDGSDSFDYKVTDTDGDSSSGKVEVTVLPVNDVPVAIDDVVGTRAGKGVTVDVTGNDRSPDGIRVVMLIDPGTGAPLDSDEKILTAQGGTAQRDRDKIVYDPARGNTNEDSFRYVVVDGRGDNDPEGGNLSNVATVRVSFDPNQAPKAEDLQLRHPDGSALTPGQTYPVPLKNFASDHEDGPLTFHIVDQPAGALTDRGGGDFEYTAPTGGQTSDRFTYYVQDEFGARSDTKTVSAEIAPPQPPPPPPSQPPQGGFLLPLGPLAAVSVLLRRMRRK